MRETGLLHQIRADLGSRSTTRAFRNNIGTAVYANGARVEYGLCPGSGDLIGWESVVITPDMVGQRVAIFLSIEGKSETGRPTKKQRNWVERVREAGGRAGIARSVAEARQIADGT